MGECLIARGQAGSSGGIGWKYKTEIITQNSIWEVPDTIDLSRGVSVRIFGGGGGGYGDGGDGGNDGLWGGGGGRYGGRGGTGICVIQYYAKSIL